MKKLRQITSILVLFSLGLCLLANTAMASPARMSISCDGDACGYNFAHKGAPGDIHFDPTAALSLGKLLGLKGPSSADGSPNPNETLDLANGYYTLHYTDVDIPVAGGLAIRLGRSYTSNWEDSATQWFLNAGFIRRFNGVSGYDSSNSNYNPLYVSSNGGTQALAPTTKGFVTAAHWSGNFDGQQYVLKDTKGVTYTFAHVAIPTLLRANAPMHQVRDYYLTKIEDLHGNTITLEYTGDNVTKITTSDGKVVTITDKTFNYGGGSIGSIALPVKVTFNGKTLRQYEYTEMTSGGEGIDCDNCDKYIFTGRNYVLSRVILPDGRSWQYRYAQHTVGPGDNNYHAGTSYYLSEVIHPDGEQTLYTVGALPSGHHIDNLNHINTVIGLAYGITSKTNIDVDGTHHTWSYHYNGNTVRITGPDYAIDETFGGTGYGLWGEHLLTKRIVYATTTAQTPLETDTYTWDKQTLASQQYKEVWYPDIYVSDARSATDDATYVPILTKQSMTREGATYTTTYSNYDSNGNPTKIVQTGDNGASRTATLTYWKNEHHILHAITSISIDGTPVVTRSYNTVGDVVKKTYYGVPTTLTYDSQGNLASQTDAMGHATTYSGYVSGKPTTIKRADGTLIKQTINPSGTIASKTDSKGNTTRYQYDGLNRLTAIAPPKPMAPTKIVYNGTAGAGGSTRTQGTFVTTTQVDGWGHPVQVDESDDGKLAKRVVTHYDANGRTTFTSFPFSPGNAGGATQGHYTTYDSLNRVLTTSYPTATTYITRYLYTFTHRVEITDPNGNVSTEQFQSYGDPDQTYLLDTRSPMGVVTTYERDALNHLKSVTQGKLTRTFGYDPHFYLTSVTNPETGVTRYGRDADGHMTSRQVGQSGVTHYAYDAMGRLLETDYPDGSPKTMNTYDGNGNLATVAKGGSVWTYTYDADNHLIAAVLNIDHHTFELHYTRDSLGHMSAMTYPNNEVVALGEDAFGKPTQLGSYATSITYYPSGQWQAMVEGNGTKVTQTLDAATRPASLAYENPLTHQAIVRTMLYDKNGNLISVIDPNTARNTLQLNYDSDNRLQGGIGPWGGQMFTYDSVGNLLTKDVLSPHLLTGTLTQYHYTNNRLTQLSGGDSATFSYDVYGDVTGDGTHTYTYGADGNLRGVKAASGTATYSYDGNGHRVKTTGSQGTVYNIYSKAGLLLYQSAPAASWHKLNVYLGRHKLAQRYTHGGTTLVRYYDSDLQGSPLAERDNSGKVLWQEQYAPWGLRLVHNDDGVNHQWYDGHPEDTISGLNYDGARYYDPSIGRFMSPDPQGFVDGRPLTFNQYMFANDDPYGYGDPTGWYSWQQFWHDLGGGINFGMTFGLSGHGTYSSGFVFGVGLVAGQASWYTGIGEARAYATLTTNTILDGSKLISYATDKVIAKSYFRSMSKAEAQAVRETGFLRGGRVGKTYFTDTRYFSATEAQNKLSLELSPETQMEFKINNNPQLELNGTRVEPQFGMQGGGLEYMTLDPVEVEILNEYPY